MGYVLEDFLLRRAALVNGDGVADVVQSADRSHIQIEQRAGVALQFAVVVSPPLT